MGLHKTDKASRVKRTLYHLWGSDRFCCSFLGYGIGNAMDLDTIAERTRPVFRRHGIRRAILFGSFATGRQGKKSDVDLILIQGTGKPFLERFHGILRELYEAIPGRDIEVFIYTPEELAGISHRKFIQRALRDGKVIYELGQATP